MFVALQIMLYILLFSPQTEGDIIFDHLSSEDSSLGGILAMNVTRSRQRRSAVIPHGTKFGLRWSITFPVRSLTSLGASFQVTHQIFLPLALLYPEKPEAERIDLNPGGYVDKEEILSKLLAMSKENIDYEDEELLSQIQSLSQDVERMGVSYGNYFSPSKLKELTKYIMTKHNLVQPEFSTNVNETESSLKSLAKFLYKESKLEGVLKKDRLKSRLDRTILYKDLQSLLEKMGLPGRSCLLRTICEVGEQPFESSLNGELLNILMMASLAGRPEFPEEGEGYNDYVNAELHGRNEGHCYKKYKECPSSIFSFMYQFIKDLFL